MSWRKGAWLLYPPFLFRVVSPRRKIRLWWAGIPVTRVFPWRSSGEKRDGVSIFARRPREVVHSSSHTIITRVMPPELRAPLLCYLSFTIIVVIIIIIIHYTFLRIYRRVWSCVRQRLSVLPKKKKTEKKIVGLNAQIPLLHVHRYVYIIAETLIIDKLPSSISTGLDCCVHWNRNFGSFVHRLLLFIFFFFGLCRCIFLSLCRCSVIYNATPDNSPPPSPPVDNHYYIFFHNSHKKPYRCYADCCTRTLCY